MVETIKSWLGFCKLLVFLHLQDPHLLQLDLMLTKKDKTSDLLFYCSLATRVLKKKKLKINVNRPVGSRVVFDDEGNTLPPLARIAETRSSDGALLLDKGMHPYSSLVMFLGFS